MKHVRDVFKVNPDKYGSHKNKSVFFSFTVPVPISLVFREYCRQTGVVFSKFIRSVLFWYLNKYYTEEWEEFIRENELVGEFVFQTKTGKKRNDGIIKKIFKRRIR